MAANENWYNAHNFYGDLAHLDAATLDDVRSFFKHLLRAEQRRARRHRRLCARATKAWIEKYFGGIPAAKLPAPPDLREPRQEKEKRAGRTDALANRPALGLAYHLPERITPEWYAFGLIDQALAQGADSLLYDELVRKRGLTGGVDAGINWGLGNMFDYSGPMLWMAQLFHDATTPSDKLLAAIDAVIERVRKQGWIRRRSIARA